MTEITHLFEIVSRYYSDPKTNANDIRILFERALKLKLKIPREDSIYLKETFIVYIESFNPDGIKYRGLELIKKLNKYSHDTPNELSKEELKNVLFIFNSIIEEIFNKKNTPFQRLTVNKLKVYSNKIQKEKIDISIAASIFHYGFQSLADLVILADQKIKIYRSELDKQVDEIIQRRLKEQSND